MTWMIYGANGYTGELIAREAVARGMAPILAGRSAAKVEALARELGLPSRVFALDSPQAVAQQLRGVRLVLLTAGRSRPPARAWCRRASRPARTTWTSPARSTCLSASPPRIRPRSRPVWCCAQASAST